MDDTATRLDHLEQQLLELHKKVDDLQHIGCAVQALAAVVADLCDDATLDADETLDDVTERLSRAGIDN